MEVPTKMDYGRKSYLNWWFGGTTILGFFRKHPFVEGTMTRGLATNKTHYAMEPFWRILCIQSVYPLLLHPMYIGSNRYRTCCLSHLYPLDLTVLWLSRHETFVHWKNDLPLAKQDGCPSRQVTPRNSPYNHRWKRLKSEISILLTSEPQKPCAEWK